MFLSKHATGIQCGRGGGDYAGPRAAGSVRGGEDYAGPRAVGSVRGEGGGILWGRAQWVPSAVEEIMRGRTRRVSSAAGERFMDVMYGCYVT